VVVDTGPEEPGSKSKKIIKNQATEPTGPKPIKFVGGCRDRGPPTPRVEQKGVQEGVKVPMLWVGGGKRTLMSVRKNTATGKSKNLYFRAVSKKGHWFMNIGLQRGTVKENRGSAITQIGGPVTEGRRQRKKGSPRTSR